MTSRPQMAGKMYLDDIVTESLRVPGRHASWSPSGPGLGVELDMSKVAEYRVGG